MDHSKLLEHFKRSKLHLLSTLHVLFNDSFRVKSRTKVKQIKIKKKSKSNSWFKVKVKMSFLGITFIGVHPNWLNWFYFLFLLGSPLHILMSCKISLSPFCRCYKDVFYFLAELDSGSTCLQNTFWHFSSLRSFYSTILYAFHLYLFFFLLG